MPTAHPTPTVTDTALAHPPDPCAKPGPTVSMVRAS
jgi:hypothetical protein